MGARYGYVRLRRGEVGIGARSGYFRLRRVMVMDCAVVNVERQAGGGGSTASGFRAQESRSSATGYD